MFFTQIVPYKKLDYFKNNTLRQRKNFCKLSLCAWIAGMLFICLLIAPTSSTKKSQSNNYEEMSLMIVKVSSAASFYQNRKTPTLTTNNIYRHNQTLADPTAATSTTTRTTALAVAVAHQPQLIATTAFMPTRLLPIRAPKHHKIRQNIIMHEAQLQQQLQHAHHQQQMMMQAQQVRAMQLQQLSHAITGETAYLLERSDNNTNSINALEAPIYGTWRTKAKRPQPSIVESVEEAAEAEAEAEASESASLVAATLATASLQGDAVDNIAENRDHQPNHHHYERLPRRAATMTPSQSELHDQLPRPPRIVSRQPSVLRRQLVRMDSQGPIDREDQQPKPFHFPHEGPMPHEFRKLQSHPEQERSEVNNIQDILKHLNLNTKPTPQLIMMPTGLHVAGSFKNFKSSGIANFFRNKRHKKHLQLAMPMQVPVHWMSSYQAPLMPAFAPHQRIAMDQFYPFKPRSPNDINLLAMQQQLQTSSSSRSKGKKKHRKLPLVTPQMLQAQQLGNQRPFTSTVIDPFLQNYPQYMYALNHSQKSKPKRVPFKLNLDIYPVATPTKDYKASAFTLEEAKILTTARPATVLRNPFAEYHVFPPAPASVSAVPHLSGSQDNLIYNGHNFPTSFNGKPNHLESPQSSNSVMSFNLNSNPFYQNALSPQIPQQQQQSHQLPFAFPSQHTNYVTPVDSGQSQSSASNANSNHNANQLLLHLNVFPKPNVFPKQESLDSSTNPFYSNMGNTNQGNHQSRQSLLEVAPQPQAQTQQFQGAPIPKVKPRCKNANRTAAALQQQQHQQQQQQKIARSDNSDSIAQSLIDFEHPIVAAEVPNLAARSEVNMHQLENASLQQQYQQQEQQRGNYRYSNLSANMDQMATEARTASLFRFPVEDLIQFQVDDAL